VTGFEIAALVTAIAGVFAGYKGVQAQNQAQERAAKIQNRQASLENQRRARRAVAQRRIMQADMIQSTETMGARSSSALQGAVGSLQTQTAANIGAANTQLAGDIGMNRALIHGARNAAQWDTIGGVFNVASQGFGMASDRQFQQKQLRDQRAASYKMQEDWLKRNGGTPQMGPPLPGTF